MAKLPAEFVKAPGEKPAAAPAKRRARKTALVSPETARALLREIHLRLTEVEFRALEDAREELRRIGQEVSLEEMLHRVIVEWSAARTAAAAAAALPPVETLIDRIRRFARSPLRSWRELGAAVRRLRGATAGI
jgi:hypothetical protein